MKIADTCCARYLRLPTLACATSCMNKPSFTRYIIRLLDRADMIEQARYVPSVLTQMRNAAKNLTPSQKFLARDLALGRNISNSISREEVNQATHTDILNAAMSLAQMRAASGKLTVEEHGRVVRCLIEESLGFENAHNRESECIPPPRPEESMPPGRLSAGSLLRGGDSCWRVGVRPAYRDLLDPGDSSAPTTQLQVMALEAAFKDALDFESVQLRIYNKLSIPPANEPSPSLKKH